MIRLILVDSTGLIFVAEAVFKLFILDILRHLLQFLVVNLFFCVNFSTFRLFFLSKEYLRAAKTLLMHSEDILEAILVLTCVEDFSGKIDDVQSFLLLSFLHECPIPATSGATMAFQKRVHVPRGGRTTRRAPRVLEGQRALCCAAFFNVGRPTKRVGVAARKLLRGMRFGFSSPRLTAALR